MAENTLDQLRQISQALYSIVVKTAKDKWEPVKLEKQTDDIYIVTVVNKKKPDKQEKYKCVFNGQRWFIV